MVASASVFLLRSGESDDNARHGQYMNVVCARPLSGRRLASPSNVVMAVAQHMNSNLFVPKSRETKERRLRVLATPAAQAKPATQLPQGDNTCSEGREYCQRVRRIELWRAFEGFSIRQTPMNGALKPPSTRPLLPLFGPYKSQR